MVNRIKKANIKILVNLVSIKILNKLKLNRYITIKKENVRDI
jgi:hypothetical protein